MRMCTFEFLFAGAFMLAPLGPGPAVATPAHPTAFLSWSRESHVEDLPSSPDAGMPLYLRINDPPTGYVALATEVEWTPLDISQACYRLVSDSALASPDGFWVYEDPPPVLGADSSFHYRLHPRQQGGAIVFKLLVGGSCGLPANFCLRMVKFVMADGDSVFAELLGGATVFGGATTCDVVPQTLSPTVAGQSEAATFDVVGGGFDEGTGAHLEGTGITRTALVIDLVSPGHIRTSFDTRGMSGTATLKLTSASGDTTSVPSAITIGVAPPVEYDSRSVIVWTKPGRLALPAGVAVSVPSQASGSSSFMTMLSTLGVEEIRSCSPATIEDPLAAAALAARSQLDIFLLQLPDTSVFSSCEALRADTANVLLCTPNWILQASDVVPGDALMAKSWHLRNAGPSTFPAPNSTPGADSRASIAWSTSTGGTPVKVGVIDSGSWLTHPDLVGRYSDGPVYSQTSTPSDLKGHGAPVAGIIAALGNGGGQAVGIDWTAEVVSIKAANDQGGFATADILSALDWATYSGCKAINASFGGIDIRGELPYLLEVYVYNAFHAGVFIAASSGNLVNFTPSYPADIYPYVVSVGASLWDGIRWEDANIEWTNWWGYTSGLPTSGFGTTTGKHLRLLAPGGRFIATIKGSTGYLTPDPTRIWSPRYAFNRTAIDSTSPFLGFGGTSAAAPVITGAAALIRSVAGDSLGAEEIAHLLAMTARPTKPSEPGYNPRDGWGNIDIGSALYAVRPGMRIERGVAFGGMVTDTSAGPIVDVMDYPPMPQLLGCKSSAYTVRQTVHFGSPFALRPLVLKRTHGSAGAMTIPVQIRRTQDGPVGGFGAPDFIPRFEPSIDTLASYPDSCVLMTRVHALYKNGQKYWWPCPPEDVRFAYTLVGIPTSALDVGPPDGRPELRLAVGPTPARDAIRVELSGFSGPTVALDLLDVQGRRVRTLVRSLSAGGSASLEIRTREGAEPIRPGLYFLRARANGRSVVRRLTVIH